MVNYESAIKRPFTDWKKLVIGVFLSIIPIVNFITYGYFIKCAKTKDKLPEWDNIKDYFITGLMIVIIGSIYILPGFILMGLGLATGTIFGLTLNSIILGILSGSLFLILAIFLLLIVSYILPIAIFDFVKRNKFEDAFKLKSIIKRSFKQTYFVPYMFIFLYSLAAGIVATFIPIIGTFIAHFAVGVTFFTVMGEVYPKLK